MGWAAGDGDAGGLFLLGLRASLSPGHASSRRGSEYSFFITPIFEMLLWHLYSYASCLAHPCLLACHKRHAAASPFFIQCVGSPGGQATLSLSPWVGPSAWCRWRPFSFWLFVDVLCKVVCFAGPHVRE